MATFSNQAINYALEVQEKYNVPASVTLAAYQLESGGGTSFLARSNNNYFGITGNGTAGHSTSSTGRKWAKYYSMEESFDSFGKLLSNKNYSALTAGTTNVSDYINAYAERYAPSSDGNEGYASKMIKIINQNDLTKYDTVFTGGNVSNNVTTNPSIQTVSDSSKSLSEKIMLIISLIVIAVFAGFFILKAFDVKLR